MNPLEDEKQALRETIWRRLEELRVATFPLPCRGRIPNFLGSELAAEGVRESGNGEEPVSFWRTPITPRGG